MALRHGFSLPEALAALAITALTAAALLLASTSALDQTTEAVDAAIAQGMVAQLMDEILDHPWAESAAWAAKRVEYQGAQTAVHADARVDFTTIDDYDGYVTQNPPRDAYGHPWGQGDAQGGLRHPAVRVDADRFSDWSVRVSVKPVALADLKTPLPEGTSSAYRRIQVDVSRVVNGQTIPLASESRVVGDLP